MTHMRRFSSAALLALMLAGAMVISTAPLEAAGGKKQGTVCSYLKAVIDYEHTSPYIKVWAIALYNYYKCEPALP